jgi:hypothetical protein
VRNTKRNVVRSDYSILHGLKITGLAGTSCCHYYGRKYTTWVKDNEPGRDKPLPLLWTKGDGAPIAQ